MDKNFQFHERLRTVLSAAMVRNGCEKKDLAKLLWPDSEHQSINMSKLLHGNTVFIKPEWVLIICEFCGVTPDVLFGV